MGLLEHLTMILTSLDLSVTLGTHAPSPAPDTYCVLTPLSEGFDVYGDNQPGVDLAEVRISLFVKANYLATARTITQALLDAGLTITGRRYVEYEADTAYHHWVADVSGWQPLDNN